MADVTGNGKAVSGQLKEKKGRRGNYSLTISSTLGFPNTRLSNIGTLETSRPSFSPRPAYVLTFGKYRLRTFVSSSFESGQQRGKHGDGTRSRANGVMRVSLDCPITHHYSRKPMLNQRRKGEGELD